MDKDVYVHCTKCKNLKVDYQMDYPLLCEYEDACNFFDPEDGRRFSERPFYEEGENGL